MNAFVDKTRKQARKLVISVIGFTVLLIGLTSLIIPLFSFFKVNFSVRDLILIAGGLFLLYKGTHEIHGIFEKEDKQTIAKVKDNRFEKIEIIEREPYPSVKYESRKAYVFAKKPVN
jgi:predicted tellurium resistance membrane protein TerC